MDETTVGLEHNKGLRSILQFAWAYELFQRSVGKNKLRRLVVDNYVKADSGDRVLDFGCGPGDLVPFLVDDESDVEYVGFDVSTEYIGAAKGRFGNKAAFYSGSINHLAANEAPFNTIVSLGVLHHIPDDVAFESLQILATLLAPGGRFIAVEPHFHDGQHWIARELIKRDRGQFVRAESAYASLLSSVFGAVSVERDEHMLRVPYSLTAFTCQN